MIGALWLATYLLHSTVLCGSVLLFRRMLRRMDGAEHLWRATMFLPLVSATVVHIFDIGLWQIGIAGRPGAGSSVGTEFTAVASWTALDVVTAAALACFTLGVLLTLRDWVAHAVFVRNLGDRVPAVHEVTCQVADLLDIGSGRPMALTSAPHAVSPMVLGRREICLPARAARDLPLDQLRALIAHEVAHVLRSDSVWFAALACLESALFVQPLNRIGRRELRHLAELSCDEWAAHRVSNPMAVAHCLVEVATWARKTGPRTVPAAASSPNGLTERVRRLIEPRVPPVRIALAPILLMLCLAAVALPGFTITALLSDVRSVHYMRGYELGREYAARNGQGAVSTRGPNAAGLAPALRQREALERRLQTEQSRRR